MKILDISLFEKLKINPISLNDFDKIDLQQNEYGITQNEYGITQNDMIGDLKGFPVSVVVKMLEETENQGNKPDITKFQKNKMINILRDGFSWGDTKYGWDFWHEVINCKNFKLFYEKYPEYKKYDN